MDDICTNNEHDGGGTLYLSRETIKENACFASLISSDPDFGGEAETKRSPNPSKRLASVTLFQDGRHRKRKFEGPKASGEALLWVAPRPGKSWDWSAFSGVSKPRSTAGTRNAPLSTARHARSRAKCAKSLRHVSCGLLLHDFPSLLTALFFPLVSRSKTTQPTMATTLSITRLCWTVALLSTSTPTLPTSIITPKLTTASQHSFPSPPQPSHPPPRPSCTAGGPTT